jgi:glucose-6-phosphate isomerase
MPSTRPAAPIEARSLATAFDAACARLASSDFASALWSRRLDVWSRDPSIQQLIANRLGWLQALEFVVPQLPRLRAFADAVATSGFTDVVLLGMGGSSLAPEVLRQVLGKADRVPRFQILDSVDPDAVRAALARSRDTLFVLASKSGSTIEPNVMAAEARRRVTAEGHVRWGSRFIAITDENTALHRLAVAEGFCEVFVNPSDIGGRYSALSLFGMVPAALMGLDVDAIVASAQDMATACRATDVRDNPGLALGALMAAGAASGRDKLTLRVPPRLESFGLWVEQLVAESTGKRGKGVVPVVGEPADVTLGTDRVLVALSVDNQEAEGLSSALDADIPHARLSMPTFEALGAEFLRWEVATAAAGWLLEINPFDEPNVQQAKDATRALLDHYREHRALPAVEPHASVQGTRLTLSQAALTALDGQPATAFLQLVRPGDYVAVLAYLPSGDPAWEPALQTWRRALARRSGQATTLGYGPRYLHSTGQLHKGGANNGVFLVLAADASDDLPVPGETFSFGVLEAAQAFGDFQSLDRTGRRAVLIQLPRRDVARFSEVADALLATG